MTTKITTAKQVPAAIRREIVLDFISRAADRIGRPLTALRRIVNTDTVLWTYEEIESGRATLNAAPLLRTATYYANRTLSYWVTPNSFRAVHCESLAQARKLIAESGIEQGLEKLEHGKVTNHRPTL